MDGNTGRAVGPRRCARSVAIGACAAWLGLALVPGGAAPAVAPPSAQFVEHAVRLLPGHAAAPVTLPDSVTATPGETLLRPVYVLQADLGATPRGVALYAPGVLNRARVQVNGHVVFDSLRLTGKPPAPRGADRLLFATVPDEWLRSGSNTIEIALEAPRWTNLSPVWVGPEAPLRRLYDRKRWWQVYAPVVSAACILALSVTVLLLWLRRRAETLYAFFGIGGVVWSLHSVWGVLPDPLLPYPHFAIWWNLGFGYFVAPIVVFCIRLAQWRLPRVERALWIALVLGPPLVYAAYAAGQLDMAAKLWRLLWVCVVGLGAIAVGFYAWGRRGMHSLLLGIAGATAFAFGLYDWLSSVSSNDNNPVLFTYFSGLVFFPLVASMLIDGFVHAADDLERLNADLERRVADKSAELRSALESMRTAKERAEGADRAKSSFLAAASHDLRQPMHALGLYMAALRAEPEAAARDDLIERMDASVGALDTLFDALLDISRIDAGAIEPQPVAFALEPMLRRLCADFAAQAADQGLRLSLRIAACSRELNACSDPLLVERILRNLLGNAIKYTQDGGVLLACRLRAAGTPQRHWRVEVWDTGPGIPAAEQEHVFEEFYQLGNPERNRAAGLGLGLSIVRRLARLLGHPLALHSLPGHGSRFGIDLPATDAPALEPVRIDASAAGGTNGTLAGMGVAVIDDDPDVRDSMTELLTRWGCDVVAGATGEEVLMRAGERPERRLHAALVDYQLRDGRNGIEAIRTLRSVCGEALPALLLSGASSAMRLAEVKASGHPWLSKPVPAARLRSWLAQTTRRVAP